MKLWIDCEFNSFEGQLLSMALVDEDDRVFYRELEVYENLDSWVADHVVLDWPHREKDSYFTFQNALESFLEHYDSVHLIADWPDDITYFTRALIIGPGERIDTPPLMLEIRRDLDAVSEQPHCALADVRAMRDKYYEVNGIDV